MVLPLSSPVTRGILVLVALALAAVLSYSGIRNARAVYFAGLGTLEGFERARQLEPGNAQNWYLLGRYWQYNLENADMERAIRAYRTALSFAPLSTDTWLALADAYESEGNPGAARDAYVHARRAYPRSAEVNWRYGNFLLREGELDSAFDEIRLAVEADPKRGAEAFSRCIRFDPDVTTILNRVLPPLPEIYVHVISDLSSNGQADEALMVWSRLLSLHPVLHLADSFPLVGALIQQKRASEACRVWDQAVALSGISVPADPPGSVIWDGGFESGVVGGGFAWNYPQVSGGVQIALDSREKHSGNQSLRLTFDGKHNVNFADVCQFVAVEPSTRYRFSAWVQTRGLTTDQGVRFWLRAFNDSGITSVWTQDLRETLPWTQIEVPWAAAKDVRILQVCVARSPSDKLDSDIAGTAWVDDVALVPEPSRGAKP